VKRLKRVLGILLRAIGITLLVLAVAAGGTYVWFTHRPLPDSVEKPLFQGVVYKREVRSSPRPLVVHTVTVDLSAPGVSLLVTPGDPSRPRPLVARSTSAFLSEPWWSKSPWDYYPKSGDPVSVEGLAVSSGRTYSKGFQNDKRAVLYVSKDRKVSFEPPAEIDQAISGSPLVKEGKIGFGHFKDTLQPRTAIGLDKEGRHLFLIAVDGRQPSYSEGMTLTELAHLAIEKGAHNAANMDGGGSTAIVAEGKGHAAEILNCPIHTRIPGRERPVANHLGVFARPLP
jgi:hypothetical protein